MTESAQPDDRTLQQFFREQMVPLAEKFRAEGVQFFPLGPDNGASWYVDYPADTSELHEFDATAARAELEALWKSQGLADLVPLAEPLVRLAEELKADADEQSDDVSPFIYVMF